MGRSNWRKIIRRIKKTMKTSNCKIMTDKKGKENGGISLKKGEGAEKTRTITKIR